MGARDRIPANGFIATLEMPCGGTPDEERHDLAVLQNELAKAVTSLTPGTEEVFFIEKLMGEFPIGGALRNGNPECGWFFAGSSNRTICLQGFH